MRSCPQISPPRPPGRRLIELSSIWGHYGNSICAAPVLMLGRAFVNSGIAPATGAEWNSVIFSGMMAQRGYTMFLQSPADAGQVSGRPAIPSASKCTVSECSDVGRSHRADGDLDQGGRLRPPWNLVPTIRTAQLWSLDSSTACRPSCLRPTAANC